MGYMNVRYKSTYKCDDVDDYNDNGNIDFFIYLHADLKPNDH